MMQNVSAVVEGGILRAVYVDGTYVEADVFDFDVLDGGDVEEHEDLLARIDASPHGTKLRTDLLTWRDDVVRGLTFAYEVEDVPHEERKVATGKPSR